MDAEWMNAKLEQGLGVQKNDAYRVQGGYTRNFKIVKIGALVQTEKSAFKLNGDTLLNGSFAYQKMGVFLRSKDSTRLSYYVEANVRLDQLPSVAAFTDHTLAKEMKAGTSLLQKNFNKLNVEVSYRNFEVLDSAFQNLKPEQTLLSRIEYDYSFLKRFITANREVEMSCAGIINTWKCPWDKGFTSGKILTKTVRNS
jgi:hypothetical protein